MLNQTCNDSYLVWNNYKLLNFRCNNTFMKQITINISEGKYQFFKELVESFDFASIVSEKEKDKANKKKEAILKSIKTGLDEVKQIKKGELKSIPLKDLLDEL